MQIYAAGLGWAGWAGLEGTLETIQPGIRDEMASAEADTETVWTLDTGHWTLDTGHWTLDCDLGKLASVRSHGQYGHGDVVDTQLQGPGSKLLLH